MTDREPGISQRGKYNVVTTGSGTNIVSEKVEIDASTAIHIYFSTRTTSKNPARRRERADAFLDRADALRDLASLLRIGGPRAWRFWAPPLLHDAERKRLASEYDALPRRRAHARSATERIDKASRRGPRQTTQSQQGKHGAAFDTESVGTKLDDLANLLSDNTQIKRAFRIQQTERIFQPQPFEPAPQLLTPARKPSLSPLPDPTFLEKTFRSRQRRELEEMRQRDDEQARQQYEFDEKKRKDELEHTARDHEEREKTRWQHTERCLDEFASAVAAGNPEAIAQIALAFVTATPLPNWLAIHLPHNTHIVYRPETRRLVILRQLPDVSVIPTEEKFSYEVGRNVTTSTSRRPTKIREDYANLIAQLTLITMHDAFELPLENLVDEVVVGAAVAANDEEKGHHEKRCLIAAVATRDQFSPLELAQVKPIDCLKGMGALVSPCPWNYEPVLSIEH